MEPLTHYAIAGSLVYAAYLVIKCPCGVPVACSQTAFYVATLAPIAYVALCNSARSA